MFKVTIWSVFINKSLTMKLNSDQLDGTNETEDQWRHRDSRFLRLMYWTKRSFTLLTFVTVKYILISLGLVCFLKEWMIASDYKGAIIHPVNSEKKLYPEL